MNAGCVAKTGEVYAVAQSIGRSVRWVAADGQIVLRIDMKNMKDVDVFASKGYWNWRATLLQCQLAGPPCSSVS